MDDSRTLAKSQFLSLDKTEAVPTPPQEFQHKQNAVIDAKYRIETILGEGGMGTVYRATHLSLSKNIALKTFRTASLTATARERFQREAIVIAKLKHENIVEVYDFGVDENNTPFYTMELLNGQSLADRIEQSGPVPVAETLHIFIQVCRALQAAHSKGVVHRDLKPANVILLNESGMNSVYPRVKLVDFGIAGLVGANADEQKLTKTGTVFGSPLYMSPEQSMGEVITETSDIYSCGCTLFETLCGKPPFRGENALLTVLMHQQEPAPPLRLPESENAPQRLQGLVSAMLEKNPRKRIQTFREVETELITIQKSIEAGSRNRQTSGRTESNAPRDLAREEQKPGGNRLPIRQAVFIVSGLIVLATATVALRQIIPTAPRAVENQPVKTKSTPVNTSIEKKIPEPALYVQKDQPPVTFIFPPGKTLGLLRWTEGSLTEIRKPARGLVKVPSYCRPTLEAGEDAVDQPELLKGFGPTDLGELCLRSTPTASGQEWSSESLKYITHMTGLPTLKLNNNREIKDDAIEYINQLPRLCELYINKTGITGTGLLKLKQLRKLNRIAVREISGLPILMEALRDSAALVEVDIKESHVKDSDLKAIASFRHLQTLNLDRNPELRSIIKPISTLKELDTLWLSSTAVGPEYISELSKMKHLTRLGLPAELWEEAQRQKLQKLLPHCTIAWR